MSAVRALSADGNFESITAALRDAAADLEALGASHASIAGEFETYGWTGLDGLDTAGGCQSQVVDALVAAAEKVGAGGQIIYDALTGNQMITRASKASLGHG